MPILILFFSFVLFGEAELSGNLSDILIDDYDFSDADGDIFHVNTNDLFRAADFINNETVLEPNLSVSVDYETQELNKEAVDSLKKKVDFENYQEEVDENYLSLDSYSLHMPKFHPQVIKFCAFSFFSLLHRNLKFRHFAIDQIPNQLNILRRNSSNCSNSFPNLKQKIFECISLRYLICIAKDNIGTQRAENVSNIAELLFFQMTEIEFSDWYFLFLSPLSNSSSNVVVATDKENVEKGGKREGSPYQLSASYASPVSDQVSKSLAEKLQVPISQFRISSVEQYKVTFTTE